MFKGNMETIMLTRQSQEWLAFPITKNRIVILRNFYVNKKESKIEMTFKLWCLGKVSNSYMSLSKLSTKIWLKKLKEVNKFFQR